MKFLKQGTRLAVLAALVASSATQGQPQLSGSEPIPRDQLPRFGTYWFAKGPTGQGLPPLPFPPDNPDLPVYALTNGQYLVDDSSVSYPEFNQKRTRNRATYSASLEGPPDPGGGEGSGDPPPPPPNIANYQKFIGHAFSVIDTNDAAANDTNLYNACISFADDTNTAPTLQIARYGSNAIIIKANRFDYTAETDRDFALLICDAVNRPLWKNIDLGGASDSQDGWLIQGLVSRYAVTDPMFLTITNITPTYNAFFRAVPYSGPQVELTGAQPYDTVANTITLHAAIADLSGSTTQQLTLLVNGLPPRYTLGPSNAIVIDTRYTPNGPVTVSATVASHNAMAYDPTNAAMDTKLEYDNTATLPLDFENQTYVYFPGDMSDPDIGVNYIVFGVTPPKYIAATITEPSTGRVLKGFSGYDPKFDYVELDWNFTEADGVTPYTNDQYAVTFTASDGSSEASTTLVETNRIERSRVRAAGWVISNYEEVKPSSEHGNGGWINTEMKKWGDATEAMYESLYDHDFFSLTQYYPWQIGSGRDNPTSPHMPFALNPTTEAGWPALVQSVVTNRAYSDFNYGPGHGNGYLIGGGEYASWAWFLNYVNTKISAWDMQSWVQSGSTGPNGNTRYKMRKVAMWCCYSARTGVYGNWHNAFGINPYQMNTLSGKNAGLFFNDDLYFTYYGSPPTDVAEVAAEFDKIWVMGANPWPGACDPNYAIGFAFGVTKMMFPELNNAKPLLLGCPYLPYAGVYDDALTVNDYSQVKTQ